MAASAGLALMPVLFWAVGVPGMLVVAAIGIYAHNTGMSRLSQRIWIGVLGGILLKGCDALVHTERGA